MADYDEITQIRLCQYSPGSTQNVQGHRFTKICIQLFGMAGHGKSSLINSCVCVMSEQPYANVAGAGRPENPNTMERKEFKLLNKVYIIDNRGVVKLNKEEINEITAQMNQLRKLGKVEWGENLLKNPEYIVEKFTDPPSEIVVPVFVYSVAYGWSEKRKDELKPFLEWAFNMTDISPIIVLTKCKNVDLEKLHKQFRDLGANYVIPVENYTPTDNVRTPEKDKNILKFLDVCVREADRSIYLNKNPQEQFLEKLAQQIDGEMMGIDKKIEELMARRKAQQKADRSIYLKANKDPQEQFLEKLAQQTDGEMMDIDEKIEELMARLKAQQNQQKSCIML
ncbi:uncharacterized protein LOC134571353 [Pelobates fuscus]|uniref:uncharacterized protein LOC134571353 n=1 Tax=Pelobates fuscus TaxID=191477 RepID=UPI002FE495A8